MITNSDQAPSARKIAVKDYNAWGFCKMGKVRHKYARGSKKGLINALLDLKNAVSNTTVVTILVFTTYMSTYTKGKWKKTKAKDCSKICGIAAGGSGITGKVNHKCPTHVQVSNTITSVQHMHKVFCPETKICDIKSKPPESAVQCPPTHDCGIHLQI